MPSSSASPAAGPSRSATAAARFSRTTGVSCTVSSMSYHDTIGSQSVAAQDGASAWQAAIAAWATYGSGRAGGAAEARGDQRCTPSAIIARSQRERSWSASSTGSAGVVEAGRAPRVLQEHEREQAEHRGLVRHQPGEQPGEPDRLVGAVPADGSRPSAAA